MIKIRYLLSNFLQQLEFHSLKKKIGNFLNNWNIMSQIYVKKNYDIVMKTKAKMGFN